MKHIWKPVEYCQVKPGLFEILLNEFFLLCFTLALRTLRYDNSLFCFLLKVMKTI